MSEQAAVTVTKVQAPNFHGLVGRPRGQQRPVVGDVHGHHRELVAVKRQEKLERVVVEHLDGAVQESH